MVVLNDITEYETTKYESNHTSYSAQLGAGHTASLSITKPTETTIYAIISIPLYGGVAAPADGVVPVLIKIV